MSLLFFILMESSSKIKKFSTIGFILASIGAAVGLGNIWRFPKEMVSSGGSSFILIYVICLFLFAFPVLLLEMQFGLFFKKGVVSCFKGVGKKTGIFFGWGQVLFTLFSCIYYLAIIAWVFVGLFFSLTRNSFRSWSLDKNYFDNNILQNPATSGETFSYWTFIGFIVLLAIIFIVIALGIKKGLEKTNIFLVPGLFFILVGLTIYSCVKPNAIYAIEKLFEFKVDSFRDLEVWRKAMFQVMFSVGILFGTFIILAKNSDIKIDKGNDALTIISADTLAGILSGILISTTVANSFYAQGYTTRAEVLEKLNVFFKQETAGGSSLLFVELPAVFYNMESAFLGQILFIFFIISLLFAAFSSIIFLIEVFIDSVLEHFPQLSRRKILLFWTLFALGEYAFFCFLDQKVMVDIQDIWINQFILLIGCYEIFKFTSFGKYKTIIKKNEQHTYLKMSKWNWLRMILQFISLPIVTFLLVYNFIKLLHLDYYIFSNFSDSVRNWLEVNLNFNTSKKVDFFTSEKIVTYVSVGLIFLWAALLYWKTKKTAFSVKANLKQELRK